MGITVTIEAGEYSITYYLAFSSLYRFRLTINILKPCLAKIFESARPRPSEAPVIKTHDFLS